MDDENAYAVTTSKDEPQIIQEPTECSSPIIWIILVVILLLILAAILAWALYEHFHNSNNKNNPIELTGVTFTIDDNSVTASWTGSTGATDFNLYVTNHPPIFGSTGNVQNTSAQSHSNKATAGNNSVTVNNLTPGLKYYATLVASNPSKSNAYNNYTQLIYTQGQKLPSTTTNAGTTTNFPFVITDILQAGAIQLGSTAATDGTYNVEFAQSPDCNLDLFFLNGSGQIQSSDSSVSPSVCLFANGNTLSAANCTPSTVAGATGLTFDNSKWSYSTSGRANQWCVTSSLSTANPLCMINGIINSSSRTSQITLGDALPSDGWANIFTGTTNP